MTTRVSLGKTKGAPEFTWLGGEFQLRNSKAKCEGEAVLIPGSQHFLLPTRMGWDSRCGWGWDNGWVYLSSEGSDLGEEAESLAGSDAQQLKKAHTYHARAVPNSSTSFETLLRFHWVFICIFYVSFQRCTQKELQGHGKSSDVCVEEVLPGGGTWGKESLVRGFRERKRPDPTPALWGEQRSFTGRSWASYLCQRIFKECSFASQPLGRIFPNRVHQQLLCFSNEIQLFKNQT